MAVEKLRDLLAKVNEGLFRQASATRVLFVVPTCCYAKMSNEMKLSFGAVVDEMDSGLSGKYSKELRKRFDIDLLDRDIWDEVRLNALTRLHGSSWLYQCGLTSDRARGSASSSWRGEEAIDVVEADIEQAIESLERFLASRRKHVRADSRFSKEVSPVHWSDIGGLESVRREILDVLELPLLHPHLFPPGAPRRNGLLLYGPPGTGKTMVARAVATECRMFFLSVKGPELLESYIGESEKNIRELFSIAKQQAPCILFFDELDSLAPVRARGSGSNNGVMDRMVSQLLAELDKLHLASCSPDGSKKFVFIIGATNRPDMLDPALLRPGRLDRRLFLGPCKDVESKLKILEAATRSLALEQEMDLKEIARRMPAAVTGADISALVSNVFTHALHCKMKQFQSQAVASRIGGESTALLAAYMDSLPDEDMVVELTQADFMAIVREMKPTAYDSVYYDKIEHMKS